MRILRPTSKNDCIPTSRLPNSFKRRLRDLAQPRELNALSCVNEEFADLIKTHYLIHEKLLITDNEEVYHDAKKAGQYFTKLKLLSELISFINRFTFSVCPFSFCYWQTVMQHTNYPDDTKVFVTDTLILCLKTLNTDISLTPLFGTYTNLVIVGHIQYHEFKKLCHDGVRKVNVRGKIWMTSDEYDDFLVFVGERIADPSFRFCYRPTIIMSAANITKLDSIGLHGTHDKKIGSFLMEYLDASINWREHYINVNKDYARRCSNCLYCWTIAVEQQVCANYHIHSNASDCLGYLRQIFPKRLVGTAHGLLLFVATTFQQLYNHFTLPFRMFVKNNRIPASKLPYGFKKRIAILAQPRDACPLAFVDEDFYNILNVNYIYYERVVITDNDAIHKQTAKAACYFSRFKLWWIFTSRIIQVFFRTETVHCFWQHVISYDNLNEEQTLYVTDTLIIHVKNCEKTKRMVPMLTGTYKYLVIIGDIKYEDFKILCHKDFIEVRVRGRIVMSNDEFDDFIEFIKERFEKTKFGFNYDSGITLSDENIEKLNNIGRNNNYDNRSSLAILYYFLF